MHRFSIYYIIFICTTRNISRIVLVSGVRAEHRVWCVRTYWPKLMKINFDVISVGIILPRVIVWILGTGKIVGRVNEIIYIYYSQKEQNHRLHDNDIDTRDLGILPVFSNPGRLPRKSSLVRRWGWQEHTELSEKDIDARTSRGINTVRVRNNARRKLVIQGLESILNTG